MSQWLGHRINEDDVLGAAQHGYGRDWFRYWHRRIVFDVVWAEGGVFDQVRAARSDKDIFDDFSWNQTYIFGHYGRGKSTKFVHSVLQRAAQGIPTFHNGPVLGGWLVEGDDIFTAMQGQRADRDNPAMPKCSVLGDRRGPRHRPWAAGRVHGRLHPARPGRQHKEAQRGLVPHRGPVEGRPSPGPR